MEAGRNRSAVNGVVAGVLAGLLIFTAELLATVGGGQPASALFRGAASIALGERALEDVRLATAIGVGTFVHFVISALYGLLYGALMSAAGRDLRRSLPGQAVLGGLFGLGVWLVNYQLVAAWRYPWFLGSPQGLQAAIHVLAYGVPLGLVLAAQERRPARGATGLAGPIEPWQA